MTRSRAVAIGGGHGLARTLATLARDPEMRAIVRVHARTSGGAVSGQVAVQATARLEQVWLEPPAPTATSEATAAVEHADLVVLGPGSLYTSVLPNLLVPGLAAAVSSPTAPVVFVANLREQPGETQGMSLADHLDAIAAHVPQVRIDTVVLADLLDGHDGHDPNALARALGSILRTAQA